MTKTIKTQQSELLLVKVPMADKYLISNIQVDNALVCMIKGRNTPKYISTLPDGELIIVNTLSKITEEECKGLGYTLVELHSLMAANEVYLSNPYSKLPPSEPVISFKDIDEAEFIGAEYKVELQQWQQAENNTSEYLILKNR